MAKFFIDRPIFAWVIAILIMMLGYLSISNMAIEQYPELAPPKVTISATYPGADANTLDNTVTQVIERQLTGIENMLYMSASSSSAGSVTITMTFANGTDINQAQNKVNNKVQTVLSQLPETVQKYGVTVDNNTGSFLKIISFYSTNPNRTSIDLADIIYNNVQQELANIEGVGGTQIFGASYAMRIWIDPAKLTYYNLSLDQVIAAITAQNAQASVGQIGSPPVAKNQAINMTVTGQGRLTDAEQFKNILVLTSDDGANIYLRDLGEIELGADNYSSSSKYNGQVSAGMAITLASGANQIQTSKLVDAKIKQIAETLPSDVEYSYPYDTTTFVELSIDNVVHTLIEAIVLVVIIIYLFLQNLRATIIPLIMVPVVLLGTFTTLYIIGFTINTLTMFAMVLAIGLLVDDAIVVVENVERIIIEEKKTPYEATVLSMQQITGALVGIGVVLSAVFIPMAFFGGAAGGIYRQFSITIVVAMALSVILAIILAPALCAQFLKQHKNDDEGKQTWVEKWSKLPPFSWLSRFFDLFNRLYNYCETLYIKGVKHVIAHPLLSLLGYILIIVALVFGYSKLKSSFLPEEDQGIFLIMFQLPTNSTLADTQAVLSKATNLILESEKNDVETIFTVSGFSFLGSGLNMGMGFVKLTDWAARNSDDEKVQAVIKRVQALLNKEIIGVRSIVSNLPSVPGLGSSSGISFILQDVGGNGHAKLVQTYYQLIGQLSQTGKIIAIPYTLPDIAEYKVVVDFEAAQSIGVSISSINNLLSAAFGSSYIDDFSYNNSNRKVYLQGQADSRMSATDFDKWHVLNSSNEMVPFSAFAKIEPSYGSPNLQRYNNYPSMSINGQPLGDLSTGDGMKIFAEYADKLRASGYNYQWTDVSYQEQETGNQQMFLFLISGIVIFLALAALYESWMIPISVLFILPLGVIGTVLLTLFAGLSNDVYFIVGLLTTMGLAAKNAILIVEFAKDGIEKEGKSLMDATLEACQLRLRPILMTSFAFIFGVLPLALSNGAGAASQNAVGIAVIGGMFSATILAIYYVPFFFILINKLFKSDKKA